MDHARKRTICRRFAVIRGKMLRFKLQTGGVLGYPSPDGDYVSNFDNLYSAQDPAQRRIYWSHRDLTRLSGPSNA